MLNAEQLNQIQAPPAVSNKRTLVWYTKKPRRSFTSIFLVIGGFAILLAIWQVLSMISADLPSPVDTLPELWKLISNPFYDHGPNDKGIGLQVLMSLGRVFSGWIIGSAIAIPIGITMGSSKAIMGLLNPIVQVLRPVSPLAWYPIGLAVYKNAGSAVTFAIVITSLWPTLINTMLGVASVPDDYRNVSRVFAFSRWKYLTKVLIPYSLPYILTGLRLSMGIAWMVIVAGEMLAGSTGIGFFVWDSWNALSLPKVISAILIIGVIGLILDRSLEFVTTKVRYST